MLRKFISIILTACMLFAIVPSVSAQIFDDIEDSKYKKSIETLAALGLLKGDGSGNFYPENTITRAEFVTVMMRSLGFENGLGTYSEIPFEDAKGHWAQEAVYYAYSMGLVDGMSETYFGVNEPVTFNQAVKIIVCMLGYRVPAENNGGYPLGFISQANKLGVLKDVPMGEHNLTRGEVAKLYLNTLTVEVAYEVNNTIQKDSDLLTQLGYTKLRGIVTSTYDTQTGGELEITQIEIGETLYEVISEYERNLIGADVVFYVKDDGAGDVIYYMEEKYETEVVNVKYDDISDETDLTTFRYYENDKLRKAALDTENLIIYYNSKVAAGAYITNDILKPDSGNVILRDKDKNGSYDIAIVNEIDTIVVQSVVGQVIYGKFGEKLDTDIDEEQLEIFVNSQKAALSDIESGSVITAIKSIDGEKISITVSDEIREGTVSAISEDEYYITSTQGEDEYTLTVEFEQAIASNNIKAERLELGKSGIFYLNSYGDIAFFKESADSITGLRYGYLVEAEQNGNLSSEILVRIMTTENTFEVYETPAGGKIKFGAVKNGSYSSDRETPKDILSYLSSQSVVTYSLDENGYLTELNLPDSSANNDYISVDYPSNACTHAEGLINQQYVVDQNTKVFCIPNSGEYEDLFAAGRYTDFFVNGSYTMELYDIENIHVGAVLYAPTKVRRYVTAQDGFETILDKVNSPILYVNKVTYATVDNEEFAIVSGYEDGVEKTVYVGDMLNGRSDEFSLIHPGSVIQYETNTIRTSRALTSDETEQMVIFKLLFDCRDEAAPQKMTYEYEDTYLVRPQISTIHSRVTDAAANFVATELGKSSKVSGGTVIMRYLQDDKRFEIADVNDIAAGQRVFIRQRYLVGREVVIFED